MLNILVTGSNGQLGSEIKEIAHHFSSFNFQFHDIDTLDITDYDSLSAFLKKNKFQYIVNCASYTQVDQAEEDPEAAFKVNAEGPENLAKLANLQASQLIHISTDYVFDGLKGSPYVEEDTPNPLSVYGKSKLEGDNRVLRHGGNMIIRTSWLYSSYGSNFVKKISELSQQKESIRVVSDQIGSPTYAGDLANTILEIIRCTSTGEISFQPGIYHYSNEGSCSWYELARAVVRSTRTGCEVIPITTEEYPLPASRPAYSVMSKDNIKSVYQIQIPDWEESLLVCMKKIKQK